MAKILIVDDDLALRETLVEQLALDGEFTAAEAGSVAEAEERLLCGARRPIVILRRRREAPLAQSVAPGNRFVGLMLPYTPVHFLMCDRLGEPIVLTSGTLQMALPMNEFTWRNGIPKLNTSITIT